MFNSKLKARITDLEYRYNNSQKQLLESISGERHLQSKVQRLKVELDEWRMGYAPPKVKSVKGERMVGLKFNALFNGVYQPTHFKTGLGPCGKTVSHFTINKADGELHIFQHHSDGTRKRFDYRLADIDGRIQYDYDMVKLTGDEADMERFRTPLAYARARVVR